MMDAKESFGERVKRLAEERGIPLDELRGWVGMPALRFNLIVSDIDEPEYAEKERFAIALKVPSEELLEELTATQVENKKRLKEFLNKVGEEHRLQELWPIVKRQKVFRGEKPMDERIFRALLWEEGLTDYGEWQDDFL